MLRSLKDLERYTVAATDGDVGAVVNFLIDDERWAVRYLVAETGSFFENRRVLISPISFRQTDWATRTFHVQLTVDAVKSSPGTDTDRTVSRQHEVALAQHYRYPYYWESPGVWGIGAYPGELANLGWSTPPLNGETPIVESHLRSVNEMRDYHVEGSDGEIGHVKDFIVDDRTWEVRYLVVQTSAWWLGKRVLIAPRWATSIVWSERKVHIRKNREEIRSSPDWDPHAAINREYELRLYDYYGRPVYWSDDRPVEATVPR